MTLYDIHWMDIMPKIILVILLTFSGIFLSAQTRLDSLYAVWKDQEQPDSTRVVAYKNYIWNGFLFSQPDTAFIMGEELIAYGLDKNYLKAQSMGYNIQGASWHVRGDYPQAQTGYGNTAQRLVRDNGAHHAGEGPGVRLAG